MSLQPLKIQTNLSTTNLLKDKPFYSKPNMEEKENKVKRRQKKCNLHSSNIPCFGLIEFIVTNPLC